MTGKIKITKKIANKEATTKLKTSNLQKRNRKFNNKLV